MEQWRVVVFKAPSEYRSSPGRIPIALNRIPQEGCHSEKWNAGERIPHTNPTRRGNAILQPIGFSLLCIPKAGDLLRRGGGTRLTIGDWDLPRPIKGPHPSRSRVALPESSFGSSKRERHPGDRAARYVPVPPGQDRRGWPAASQAGCTSWWAGSSLP